MARQPEVFVRSLEPDEAQRLVKITRTTRDRVRLRRAGIVPASVQGPSPRYWRAMLRNEIESTMVSEDAIALAPGALIAVASLAAGQRVRVRPRSRLMP